MRSNNNKSAQSDVVIGDLPIQEYIAVGGQELASLSKLENPLGMEDIRVILGALDMPGLTAYLSLFKIGKPKKGETIFVSASSGAVGALVGQLCRELRSARDILVGSDERLEFITKHLGFDGGISYKTERLAMPGMPCAAGYLYLLRKCRRRAS